jgi:hypothetical protein
MKALELVGLPPLMAQTSGRREITIGLIDGPIVAGHPDFEGQNIRELREGRGYLLSIEQHRL